MVAEGLSIIIPSFKPSKKALETLVYRLIENFAGHVFEIIVVNDHSPEEYDPVYRQVEQISGEIRVIKMPQNSGQFRATIMGCHSAKYPLIATIDDDMEYNPEYLKEMLEYSADHRLVYGLPPDEQLEVLIGLQRWVYLRLIRWLNLKRCSSLRIFHRDILLASEKYFQAGIQQLDIVFQEVASDIYWYPISKQIVNTQTRFKWLHLGYFFSSLRDMIRIRFFLPRPPTLPHTANKAAPPSS